METNFFARAFQNLRNLLFPADAARRDFDVESAISTEMQQNIALWHAMYINKPPWAVGDVEPLGLPAAIAREMARPALIEFSATVTGSARADALNGWLQTAAQDFGKNLEIGLALGGLTMRPYIYNGTLRVDASSPLAFQPTAFDEAGKCVGGTFRERIKFGNKYYIRLENHEFQRDGDRTVYIVKNQAHESNQHGSVGRPVELSAIPQWAGLEPETTIENLERPLFAFFTPPIANNIDTTSKMGVSVFGGSIASLVRDADEQWDRLWWEFRSGERKIFAEYTINNAKEFGRNRLYEFGPFMSANGDFYREFSPELRDAEIYRGFQDILRQIEFQTGLAFGTISDPAAVEKTATEVLAGKQRQYVTEKRIQSAFGAAVDDLVYAMDVYATLYDLAPAGNYNLDMVFGDGILDDPEANRQEKSVNLQEINAGLMSPWEYRMRWFGETEAEARANLPTMDALVDETQTEIGGGRERVRDN